MHSSRELDRSMFEIRIEGREARLGELFEGFDERDRLGVVVTRPCGAVGASALITSTVTAFYDIQRERGPDFFVYPDYYLFHLGRPHGDHGMLDVFPSRKEVVVPAEPGAILDAINDRAVTRLVVPEGEDAEGAAAGPAAAPLDRVALASAVGRIATCLAYSSSGRVRGADVRIASNPVVEGYVRSIVDPEAHIAALRAGDDQDRSYADSIAARLGEVGAEQRAQIAESRRELVEDGAPVETYRRITLDEALARLARGIPAGAPAAVPPAG
jgi:hypothetical protein